MNIKIYKNKLNEMIIDEIIIESKNMEVSLINLGATIKDIKYINKKGIKEKVVAHPIDIKDFYQNRSFYGKTIGRTTGRIENGEFELNGIKYILDKNDGENSFHGGNICISDKIFDYYIEEYDDSYKISFTIKIKELDDHYPGNIDLVVNYYIYENEIKIEYIASSDNDTLCNIANHPYFNLSGNIKRNVLDHELRFKASTYTLLREDKITKSIEKVNSIMDFNEYKKIGKDIFDESIKKHSSNGYDHCYFLDDNKIELKDNHSKRKLTVKTSYPSVVIYTTNYPDHCLVTNDHEIDIHDAVAIECQYVPNGINMEGVDKAILRKGETYHHFISYLFSIE